ncbi:MAG: ImmA/IrrE family metallo-endopeptidase [bacterium]|nr:ImmA/IrrE family metallo-endopeptidase [bacterium]
MPIKLRYGFKTEAESHARELRKEMQIQEDQPICPWALAEHLAIRTCAISKYRQLEPKAIDYLIEIAAAGFSAVTLFFGRHGTRRIIVYNDGNARTRQTADIAHELTHAILGHSASKMFQDDAISEEEAKWMGPCLLIPMPAAMRIVRQSVPESVAAREFGVSPQLMRMRLNASGARIIHSRRKLRYG